MKSISILLLLLFPFYGSVVAQEFNLKSIEEFSIDSMLSTNDIKDLNGKLSAVVVLSFQEPIDCLSFRGNILEQVVINERTYVLYVADRTKRITIQHENYYPFILDFSNNNIRIDGGHSYKALLDNKKIDASNTYQQELGSQYLVFKSETKVKNLKVDGKNWETVNWYGQVAKKMVPLGIYHYEAISEEGKIIKGEVKVNSNLSSKVVNLIF